MSQFIPVRLFVCLGFVIAFHLAAIGEEPEESPVPMILHANVETPTRDGVTLRADVYLPSTEGEFPAILLRTPYSAALGELSEDKTVNDLCRNFAAEFIPLGFAFVIQDCRGTGRSGGEWDPYINERNDGIDLQEWVTEQTWCNGNIALFGGSYCGNTQWAVADHAEHGLKAMVTDVPLFNYYDVNFTNGAYRLECNTVWNAFMTRPRADQDPLVSFAPEGWSEGLIIKNGNNWTDVFRHLPLRNTGRQVGEQPHWLRSNVRHPAGFDDYWRPSSTTDRLDAVAVPNLTCSGWYDLFMVQALNNLPEIRRNAKNETAREHQHLIIGPWGHMLGESIGDLVFGDEADLDLAEARADWYRHWLTDEDTGVEDWPFLKIFVMGDNQWRNEQEWPLERTEFTNFYFHSGGSANSRTGDGRLNINPPSVEPMDDYVYDPEFPVPSVGGYWSFLTPCGPCEQGEVENREDVLVFTSEALTEPMEVTGPVKVVLYASSDALDTDWTAKLVDVHPDGQAYNLCEGIQRARFRVPDATPTLIEPGKIYRYEIDLWATSNAFLPGHQIRVQISSSNFPCFDRNPNTGHSFGFDIEMRQANQTIYHDEEHPSHIVLPVIPR
jgi:uncharacterized protein